MVIITLLALVNNIVRTKGIQPLLVDPAQVESKNLLSLSQVN